MKKFKCKCVTVVVRGLGTMIGSVIALMIWLGMHYYDIWSYIPKVYHFWAAWAILIIFLSDPIIGIKVKLGAKD